MPSSRLAGRFFEPVKKLNRRINGRERRGARRRLFSRPMDIDLVVTKACNLACVFCKDYETSSGSRRVPLPEVKRVARQLFPLARRLNVCSGGEPYLHPQLEDILRLAKRYGLATWVLSNGTVMTESRVRQIVGEGLVDEHGFSVDGFHGRTVESIRLKARLADILSNIEMLQRLKRQSGTAGPRLIVRYALMRANIVELPLAVRRWGEMGIDELQAAYVSPTLDMDPRASLYYHQEILEESFERANEAAKTYPGLKLSLPRLIREDRNRAAPGECRAPWSFVMIDTNGEVMPCYRSFEALRLGRVYGRGGVRFARIWNSRPYRELRRTVNGSCSGSFYPYCRVCEVRRGWGEEGAHSGDRRWMEVLGPDWLPRGVDHRRSVVGRPLSSPP